MRNRARDCILVASFLLSCALYRPVGSQCTPSTPPPPELRPLDNDADLLPDCSLPSDRDQKSAISETTAQRLALCNSFCINRVFSGDFVRNGAQKQIFPGYPVWLLATQSYLLSDEGTTTDCLVGGNSNGCTTNCNRFTPPFNFFGPTVPGGFLLAQDCKLGCMLQFESPSSSCAEDCRMNCNSVACQCGGFFGDGCFNDQAPPCGRDCSSTSCGHGCTDANLYTTNTPTYPSSANPTQAPEVTQIGNGTRYMINITNSIPSGVSGDLGYSTLIVRILDLSSTTPDDYTYYVLENGFEFDLAPFVCRGIEVSFAVATNQMAVSSYSPSIALNINTAGPTLPGQLTDFNFTVEQDNRAGFFQHHIIHLEWDPPRNVEFATGYTITLSPHSNQAVCLSATFDLTNGSLTSFTIQSNNATQPPLTNCIYYIQIEVNPRESESAVQKSTPVLIYNSPSANNIAVSCSSVLDRSSIAYDLTFRLQLDETFTPAVISAIQNLVAGSFQVRDNGDVVVGATTHRRIPLGSNVTQGPVTVDILYDNFDDLPNGLGYHLSVTLEWVALPMTPPFISVDCLTYDVRPIAPDPVENLQITFQQALPQSDRSGSGTIDRIFITLRYTWIAPEFVGEGITGYQAWLAKEPTPERGIIAIGNLHQIGPNATSDELRTVFNESDTNFTLYFQIRPISANTLGNWSEAMVFNVQDIPPTALNVKVTCSSVVNITTRSYDITVLFYIDATFTSERVAAIESIKTTIIEVDGNGNAVPSNIRRVIFPFSEGIERGPGSVALVIPNKTPLSDRQSFYSILSFLVWKSSFPSLPSTVGGSCQLHNVGPFPPDPVTNLQLLSSRKSFSADRKSVVVMASFNWTAPEFTSGTEDIVGYQVWFDRMPAPSNVTRFVTHGAQVRSAEVEMVFNIGDTDFSLFLQIRALGASTLGNWSQADSIVLQVQVPCPLGFFRDPSVTSFQCIPCPANTNLTLLNEATVCPCLPSYFRAPGDNPGVSCSRPPTACRNIRVNLLGDRRIDVTWEKPFFTGRDDFYYVLEWSVSVPPPPDSQGFSSSGINGSFTIFDQNDVVSQTITGLRPETPYSVVVIARNGVSNQDDPRNEDSRICRLEVDTLEAANGSISIPPIASLTTLLGCDVDVACGGTGLAVTWRRFGSRIDLTDTANRTITVEQNPADNTIQSHLMIDPIVNGDAGAYTCIVIDFTTTSMYGFSLSVNNTFAYVEPIEDIELSDDQLGHVITINCRVSTCRDNAEVVLARDFEIINRAELFSDATNVVLSTDLVASDNITGNYLCRVILGDVIHQNTFRITRRIPPVICPLGTYKNATSIPFECLPCPTNTNQSVINATICPCLPGYFRTSSEGPEIGCTRPPSACRNIKSNHIGAQSLNVQWERPEVTGRDDYYYMLEYSDGESVGSNQVINQSQVVSQLITGLKSITDYTITVTVVNGVSDQDKENEFKRTCELAVTTTEGVPSRPVDVLSYGDVVVWNEPLNPNGQITEYEIQFLVPGTQLRISRSRNRRGTFYAVQDEDQLGGLQNTYFRVRARTSAGAGQWSAELPLETVSEETPTPPTTCPPCSCPICTCPMCPTTVPPCTCGTETPTSPPQPQGVHFVLRGQPLANNSEIALADIGELEGALLCRTNLTSCCGTVPNRFGQFYYPSGVAVPINNQRQGFYRNRGDQEIRLHRRSGVNSPTGKFRCEIPDSNMSLQNLFIELI